MANWCGESRSNYFRVKDAEAFKAAMSAFDVKVWDKDDFFALGAGRCSDGDWPSYDAEADEDFDFADIVSKHLADGEIAVFMTIGAEKIRYLTGYAVAFNNKGERESLSLDRIYDFVEQRWGVQPTRAEY